MFNYIQYPYMNSQQLNLDWLLERVANTPEIVHVPALAGSDLQAVADMIDAKALDIPKGLSFMQAGELDDPIDHQCLCMIFKNDNDNILVFALGQSDDITINAMRKNGGTWS